MGERRIGQLRRLVGLKWEDAAQHIYAMFRDIFDAQTDGSIPPGVTTVAPSTIEAGATAAIGSATDGWSPGPHVHGVNTTSAVGLANANAEGTGAPLARAAHTHKRDVRIKAGATDNIRNAIRFIGGDGVSVTAADDSGDDETEVTITATVAAEEAMFYAWFVGA